MRISGNCSTFAADFKTIAYMKKSFIIYSFVIFMLACTKEPTSTLQIEPFDRIEINARQATMNIVLEQKDVYQIGITSSQTDSLFREVKDKTLYVSVPTTNCGSYDIQICAPEFKQIHAYLVSNLHTPDTIRQDSLSVITDVDNVHLNMQVNKLHFTHYTDGKICLCGKADTSYLDASYAKADLDASRLITKDMHLRIGECKAKFHVTDHFWIDETFNSQITYVGTPEIEECKIKWSILKNALFFY